MGRRGFGRPWGQYFGLLVLAAGTVVLIYLALTRNSDEVPDVGVDPTTGLAGSPTGSGSTPSVEPTGSGTDDPTDASETPSLDTTPPSVRDQRRVDFTAGDDLPDGALIVDGGANETGLAVTRQGLTHGKPTSGNLAAGVIEVELDGDVKSLGLRVRFAEENSGAVTLVGWQDSIAAVSESGSEKAPNTGFRLVATPGAWTLSVLDDATEDVLAEGTYDATDGAETFQIVRSDEQVWVIDPTGAVTTATDPRVGEFAGPWASWGVTESAVDQTPAVIESLWGG